MKDKIIDFVNNNKDYPVISIFSAGLYPLLYYYSSNFTQVNSWSQFTFFIGFYILLPLVLFAVFRALIKRIHVLKPYLKYTISIANLCVFGFLMLLSTYGLKLKLLALVLVITFLLAIVLWKQIKKIVVIQLIMSVLAFTILLGHLYKYLTYEHQWLNQPDDIESVVFKETPNIYVIQVDGYANFSKLNKEPYLFDNTDFETSLQQKGFTFYENYRSNYSSTLSSNLSMFGMAHHYYLNPKKAFSELQHSRETIIGENPVLRILKNNNYKTHLIIEKPYFIINRPKMFYDYCNVEYSELSYLDKGFKIKKDVISDLKNVLPSKQDSANFYFIQKILPSHVTTSTSKDIRAEDQRNKYLNRLKEANYWLNDIIKEIESKDTNSLIVISADHGGFVGFQNTKLCAVKQVDANLIHSIFTSVLAIKWPDKLDRYNNELKTPVNFFRILFSYLSKNEDYLNHLKDDKSYIIINEGAPFGVYEYINEKGETTFNNVLVN